MNDDYKITVTNHAYKRWGERVPYAEETLETAMKMSEIIKADDIPPFPLARKPNTTYCSYRNNVVFVCEAVDYKHLRVITVITANQPEDNEIYATHLIPERTDYIKLTAEIDILNKKKGEIGDTIAMLRKHKSEINKQTIEELRAQFQGLEQATNNKKAAIAKILRKAGSQENLGVAKPIKSKEILLEILNELRGIRMLLEEQNND